MSDAVMVPMTDPDAIWLEPSCCADPSHGRTWSEDLCFPVCEDGREPVKYVRADLSGGWERTDIQRLMHPVLEYLSGKNVGQRIAEEASERAVDVMYRALNAPPSVSTDNGSLQRQGASVPTEYVAELCSRLDAIVTEEDKFHPVGCSTWWEEARVAVDMAKDFIIKAADGCSSNEGAGS